jgi:peptidoglycan hydrolase-like protein with peptidoglycan-binding domain
MKKVISTLLFATAVCGLLASQPAEARLFKTSSDTVQTRSVTETTLTRSDILSIQTSLSNKGFYSGSIDGKWGPMTSRALASFQSAHGMTADGVPSRDTLAMLGVAPNNVANIEPAAGGVTVETTTTYDTFRSRASGGFVAINTNHINGAACKLCTNGIIGNGGTPSMRSNEY